MLHFSTCLFSLAIAIFSAQVTSQASNNDPNGKSFFISEPSCDFYQCHVMHKVGDRMIINWLSPLAGNININFVPDKNGTTYRIASKLPANHKNTKCDKGGQKTCGAYTWKIPATVMPGVYSVEIHSLTNKKLFTYTDLITIST